MSQRQLASRSGVSHATISRLLNEGREPSLGTAMDLARVLLDLESGREQDQYVGAFSAIGTGDPEGRVAHALTSDPVMDDVAARQVMQYYLAVRQKARPRGGSG